MSRAIAPFGLRLPPALREKLEAASRENKRSLTSEINARLEQTFASAEASSIINGAFLIVRRNINGMDLDFSISIPADELYGKDKDALAERIKQLEAGGFQVVRSFDE